jgi:hypothetical protein
MNKFKKSARLPVVVTLVSVPLMLGACTDSKTYLKNESVGEVVTCGSFHPIAPVVEWVIKKHEARCIQTYKEQGYVLVPGPK